jgi:hypothetical protein
VAISDTLVAPSTFGIYGIGATIETLLDGVVVASLPSANYLAGTSYPALTPVVVAGGSTHTYAVRVVTTPGSSVPSVTSAPVTYTATLYPSPSGSISITGITTAQDMPTYLSPNYDFVYISGQVNPGLYGMAIEAFNGNGQIVATMPIPASASNSTWDFTLPPVVVTEVNTNYTYELKISYSLAGGGNLAATSTPVTVYAPLYAPLPSPGLTLPGPVTTH